ncbi:MAG: hypothetical protein ACTSRS_11140 [Candidatus Helarchaeota archaeon]
MDWKKTMKKTVKFILLLFYSTFIIALIVGPIVPAVTTLLPSQVSKPNFLGYNSICPFVPYSTLILLSLIILGVVLLVKTKPIYKVIHIFKSE